VGDVLAKAAQVLGDAPGALERQGQQGVLDAHERAFEADTVWRYARLDREVLRKTL
jgi:hypothetical protein